MKPLLNPTCALTAPEPTGLTWDADALQERLALLWPGLGVEVLAECTSTSSVLLERARLLGDALPPTLLVAEEQSQGRGRMGRAWHASRGTSLTFSLVLGLAPRDWSGLSLAVGLALAEALDPQPGGLTHTPHIGLKWPNDVWLCDGAGAGCKLAGILIETRQAGACRVAVIGIGLNVLPQPNSGPSAGSACWAELLSRQGLDPARASAPAALAQLAEPLLRALSRFQDVGFVPLVAAFAARDVLRGQPVRSSTAGGVAPVLLDGLAEGVDAQGALCLRVGGQLQRLVSGEISVRLQTALPR